MSYKQELQEHYRRVRERMGMGVKAPVVPKALLIAANPHAGVAGGTGVVDPALPPMVEAPPTTILPVAFVGHEERAERGATDEDMNKIEREAAQSPKLPPLEGFDRSYPVNVWRRLLDAVAAKHGLTVQEMLQRGRSKHLIEARFEAMYRMRVELKMSYLNIAAKLGRDHSSVIHAVSVMRNRLLDGRAAAAHPMPASHHQHGAGVVAHTPELAAA